MARPTFLALQKRLKFLIGEDGSTGADATTTGATQKSHINSAIIDIINQYPFSWNTATTNLTVASGVSNLPADFNPKWAIEDARDADDNVYLYTAIQSRDADDSTYQYWITYDTTADLYVFNTNQDSATVTIYYHFTPAELTTDAGKCIVPDQEAVAYLAGAKHWISDERNEELQKKFDQEWNRRVQALYIQDLNFGPAYGQGAPTDYETQLRGE
jgi:predicted nucleic acid-binding protein